MFVKVKEVFMKKKCVVEVIFMADRRATYVVKYTRVVFEGDVGLEVFEYVGM